MILNKTGKQICFYLVATLIVGALLLPFFWMVSTSLKEKGALLILPIQWFPEKPSLQAFYKVFTIFPFGRAVFNSIYIAVATTIISVLSAAMAAYVFAKIQFRGREKLFAIYLATMMIPGQVTMIPNFLVLKFMGLLNTFTGLMLPAIFNAFGVFLLRQEMRLIPDAYIEAAVIDGASPFTIFHKVILALSKPALATLTVLTFMGTWNDYLWPLIILNDPHKMTLPIGLSVLNGQYSTDYNILMAGSLISMIPIIFVYFLAQKYFMQGLNIGGIKG